MKEATTKRQTIRIPKHYIFRINLYKPGVLSFWTKADSVAPNETPHTVCLHEFHHKNKIKNENRDSDAPNNQNGPAQLIRLGKSIRHIWVK